MLISVIIPTYNRSKALLPTLASALNQTYSPLEIFVIDDASTDDTYAIASSTDPRVKVIRHPHNRGVSAAINTGIQAARGDLIAILEHDDIWLPNKLAKQAALFQHASIGLVYCGVAMVNEKSEELSHALPQKRGCIYRALLFKSYISTSSAVVVRRACFDQAGLFDETLQGPQDYDMWIRIAHAYAVDYVPEVLVHFAAYPHPRLNSPSRLMPMYDRLNQKFATYEYPSALFKRRVMAYRHYTLAGIHGVSRNFSAARHEYWQSLTLWPFNLKSWLGLSATLAGPQTYDRFVQLKDQWLNTAFNR